MPPITPMPPAPDIAAALRQALELEDQDRLEDALAAYDAMIDALLALPSPTAAALVAVWSNRAGLLMRSGRNLEALASLNHALEADPQNQLLCLNKGLLLLQGFDRPQDALSWLERAPQFPEAAEAIAFCRAAAAQG